MVPQSEQLPTLQSKIRLAAETNKVKRDNRWRDSVVGRTSVTGVPIVVGGRVDGYSGTTGALIEVKNRVHRLFDKVVDYEKVQLHVSCPF